MNVISWVVLALAGGATLWMSFYVRYSLPLRAEERLKDSMKAFGRAIELRFPSHKNTTDDVVELSLSLGRKLQLSRLQLLDLEMAARLRDIGLCAIPYALVNGRNQEDWNPAEKATYERHPEISGSMLESVPSLRHLSEIVRHHHSHSETCNVPIQARILNVASEYVWAEKYQGRLIARDMILTNVDNHFDPKVVDALHAVLTSSRVDDRYPSPVL